MRDLRRSSTTYAKSLFLHVVKHNFLFLFFFSVWVFFQEYSRFPGQEMKGEAISLYPFYHFHLLYRQLGISWVIAAESSPLRIAGSRNRTWNTLCYTLLEFTLSTLALLAAVVRKMLKTRVTLGNISRFLLILTKRLIFLMFKDSSSLSMFTQLALIYSL